MEFALVAGRIFLVAIFVFSGVAKLIDVPGTAAYIAAKGLPLPQLLAAGAGGLEVFGALLVLIGWQTRLAAAALAAFTVVAAFFFHDFWNLPAGAARMGQMVHAWKNLSIVGGLIVLAVAGPGRWSIEGWRRPAGARSPSPPGRDWA